MPRVAFRLKSTVSLLALGLAISAAPALAVPATPSVFSEVPAKPQAHYYEHISDSPEENGLTGADMNADGSVVVGGVQFEGEDNNQRFGQAAAWSPEPDSLMFLGDSLVDPDSDESAVQFYDISRGDADELSYLTFATDIAAGSERIVGVADGRYLEGEEDPEFDWQLPLYWNKTANGWSSAKLLPVINLVQEGEGFEVGGANAISDHTVMDTDMEFIAGFSGVAQETNGEDPSDADFEATMWIPDEPEGDWVATGMGYLDNEDEDSIANDVNDKGQAVGWSGYAGSYEDVRRGWTATSPHADFSPRPFVYDLFDDAFDEGMQKLTLDPGGEEPDYAFGEGRAISNDGNLAVGWVAQVVDEEDGPPLAAAWTPTEGTWATNSLMVLDSSLGPSSLPDEAERVGSMAEAVDDSGHVIVGKAVYDDDGDDEDLAVYWQLDDNMNVVRAESIQGALENAGVGLDGKDFPSGDSQRNHRLTDATAVRVVNDEASGDPKSIVVTGTGTGSYGSWIAKLGKFAAITTPVSVGTTITTIDKGTKLLAAHFADFADNEYCQRGAGASVATTPLCYWVSGGASGYGSGTTAGGSLGSQFGIARYLDDENSVGVSGGLDAFAGGGPGASSYDTTQAVLGGYAAHMPEQGVQARVAVSLGAIIDASFERVYANGGGSSTSTGHTSGAGFGAVVHMAYATPIDELTTLMPYVELNYGAIHLGGYTEHDGAFPGVFSAIDAQRLTASVGVDATHKLDDRTKIFGGVSLSGVYLSGTGVNASIAGLPFGAGAGPMGYGLLSGTVGASLDLDPLSVLSGRVTASTNFGSFSSAGVMVSYSHSL